MKEPVTNEEWQEAVNAAYECLLLDSAIQYGLVKRVPVDDKGNVTKDWWYRDSGVSVERCVEILNRPAENKLFPQIKN